MPALRAGTVLALVLFLAAALACEQRAAAHSWYPAKCCAGHDCRKVDSIEKLEDGDLLFRAGPVLVVVPAEFMRLPSPDNDTHVCVYKVGSGEYRPRCVFVPGLI
jgi:hypothetical protein